MPMELLLLNKIVCKIYRYLHKVSQMKIWRILILQFSTKKTVALVGQNIHLEKWAFWLILITVTIDVF